MKIVLASKNKGKLKELREMFKNFRHITIIPFNNRIPASVEQNRSFAENSYKKALFVFKKTGLPALADDSGLIVEALPDELGVRSKRFGKPGLTDREKNLLLLEKLKGLPKKKRRASFICALSLILKNAESFTVIGKVDGYIAKEIRGTKGFGYDPVFIHPKYNKTFAELYELKNKISHRAIAVKKLIKLLNKFFLKS